MGWRYQSLPGLKAGKGRRLIVEPLGGQVERVALLGPGERGQRLRQVGGQFLGNRADGVCAPS